MARYSEHVEHGTNVAPMHLTLPEPHGCISLSEFLAEVFILSEKQERVFIRTILQKPSSCAKCQYLLGICK